MGTFNNFTTHELQDAVCDYKLVPSKENGTTLGKLFYEMAEQLLQTFKSIVPHEENSPEQIKQLAIFAFTRVDSFEPEQGRAVNYFSSVMLSNIKRQYKIYKKQVELEERYGRYVP